MYDLWECAQAFGNNPLFVIYFVGIGRSTVYRLKNELEHEHDGSIPSIYVIHSYLFYDSYCHSHCLFAFIGGKLTPIELHGNGM